MSSPIYPKPPFFSSLIWSFTTQKPIPSRKKPALNLRYIPMMGALFQSSQYLPPSIGISDSPTQIWCIISRVGGCFFWWALFFIFFSHTFWRFQIWRQAFLSCFIDRNNYYKIQNNNKKNTHTEFTYLQRKYLHSIFFGVSSYRKHQFSANSAYIIPKTPIFWGTLSLTFSQRGEPIGSTWWRWWSPEVSRRTAERRGGILIRWMRGRIVCMRSDEVHI